MRFSSWIFFLVLGGYFAPNFLFAQTIPENRFHLELEPLQFANRGWSVVGHYALNDRLQIGTNVFASVLSEGLNDFVFDVPGEGDMQARQNLGINLSIRYFLQKRAYQEGWLVSLPIGWERWTLRETATDEAQRYSFWYLSPRIGYLWYPFSQKRFYILGEAVGVLPILKGNPADFEEISVEIRSFIPFPGVGIGLAF